MLQNILQGTQIPPMYGADPNPPSSYLPDQGTGPMPMDTQPKPSYGDPGTGPGGIVAALISHLPQAMADLSKHSQEAADRKAKSIDDLTVPHRRALSAVHLGLGLLGALLSKSNNNPGAGFIQGAQGELDRQNEDAQTQYQQELQRRREAAAVAQQQADRQFRTGQTYYQNTQAAKAQAAQDAQQKIQNDFERQRIAAMGDKSETAARQKRVSDYNKVLGDPKSTIAARQYAIQGLIGEGYQVTPETAKAMLEGTYYQAGQEAKAEKDKAETTYTAGAKTNQANANADYSTQRAMTEELLRPEKLKQMQERTKLFTSQIGLTDNRAAQVAEVTKEMPEKTAATVAKAYADIENIKSAMQNRMATLDLNQAAAAEKRIRDGMQAFSSSARPLVALIDHRQKQYNAETNADKKKIINAQIQSAQKQLETYQNGFAELQKNLENVKPPENVAPAAIPGLPATGAPFQVGGIAPPSMRGIGGTALGVNPTGTVQPPATSSPLKGLEPKNSAQSRQYANAMKALKAGASPDSVRARLKKLYAGN